MAFQKAERVLLVARHGKAEPASLGVDDHSRSLIDIGEDQCAAGNTWLSDSAFIPDMCVSSDAVRTRSTARLLLGGNSVRPPAIPVSTTPELYECSVHAMLELAAGLAEDCKTALLVGHQPTVSGLVAVLTGRHLNYPTGTIAALGFDIPWSQMAQDSGWVVDVFRPNS